jgi:hypothetical protein
MRRLIIGGLAALALILAPQASADQARDRQMQATCEVLDEYPHAGGVQGASEFWLEQGMSVPQVTGLLRFSGREVCPQHSELIERFLRTIGVGTI